MIKFDMLLLYIILLIIVLYSIFDDGFSILINLMYNSNYIIYCGNVMKYVYMIVRN